MKFLNNFQVLVIGTYQMERPEVCRCNFVSVDILKKMQTNIHCQVALYFPNYYYYYLAGCTMFPHLPAPI